MTIPFGWEGNRKSVWTLGPDTDSNVSPASTGDEDLVSCFGVSLRSTLRLRASFPCLASRTQAWISRAIGTALRILQLEPPVADAAVKVVPPLGVDA